MRVVILLVVLQAVVVEVSGTRGPPQSVCRHRSKKNRGAGRAEVALADEQQRILFVKSKKTGGSTIGGVLRAVAHHYGLYVTMPAHANRPSTQQQQLILMWGSY